LFAFFLFFEQLTEGSLEKEANTNTTATTYESSNDYSNYSSKAKSQSNSSSFTTSQVIVIPKHPIRARAFTFNRGKISAKPCSTRSKP